MTTKTTNFPTVQNPLSSPWVTTYTGLQCTSAGVVKGISAANTDDMSTWSTSDYTFANDQTSQITFSNIGNNDWPGATVRITGSGSSTTGYVVYAINETTSINIYKLATSGGIGSGSTNLVKQFTGQTLTGSHTLKLQITGTTLTVFFDGTSLGTATDSTYSTGQPGIAYEFGNTNVSQINSWTGTDGVSSYVPTNTDAFFYIMS
jgi:hypothetical protein